MSNNLSQVIKLIFGHEGGYVNNPNDNGGATKYGITAATLGAWRKLGRKATPAEVKMLTLSEATSILRKQYANPLRYDELPAGLDYALFDFSVNSGPAKAVKSLQKVLGVGIDGIIGARTMAAIMSTNTSQLINKLCDDRMRFLQSLSDFKHFGKGWTTRVSSVRAGALKMAPAGIPEPLAKPAQIPPTAQVQMPETKPSKDGMEVANPADQKVTSTRVGKGTIISILSTIGTAVAAAKEALQPMVGSGGFTDKVFAALVVVGIAGAVAGSVYALLGRKADAEEAA